MKSYDLAIIGSGPGGYVAALYASRHNLNVCVIEKDHVGGACLNYGCIPTKSFLNSASIINTLKLAPAFGINIDGYNIDFPKIVARKNEVVTRLRTGIETLFKANKIDLIRGTARLAGPQSIMVNDADRVEARNIIIATGSSASELPGIRFDHSSILSSTSVLDIQHLPASICIIGGGVIGCEFANFFNALGVKVSIVELMDRLIPMQSREVSRKLDTILRKKGVDVFTSAKIESVENPGPLKVKIEGGAEFFTEKILVSVGRIPNTAGLGLEEAGVKIDQGRVRVDEDLRTTVPGIYAIGDCVVGPLLAHKASYDGILACDNIMGKARKVDYSNIPSCIWTEPQVASVGISEDDARSRLTDVKIAKFPYLASGKAYLLGKYEGFVKIIGNSQGQILGVEIFGEEACELIGEAVLAKTAGINIKDWAGIVHGHPTLSEILQEAAHVFCGTGIHTV